MNMLMNKEPYDLMTGERREAFRKLKFVDGEAFYEGGWVCWGDVPSNLKGCVSIKLKPKVGEYYTFNKDGQDYTRKLNFYRDPILNFDNLIGDVSAKEFNSFRPATQEEIDSVNPQFKSGDVIVVDEFNLCRSGFCGSSVDFTSIHFGVNWATKPESFKHATKDQIKQLELEEMKHGKKWNGEGYDDWLTADGLTLNELLEHDLSEIEFENPRGKSGWHLTDVPDLEGSILCGVNALERYRIKPKEIEECMVKGCTNKKNEGGFVGDLCSPCHEMITTGKIGSGATFIHKMKKGFNRKTNSIRELADNLKRVADSHNDKMEV